MISQIQIRSEIDLESIRKFVREKVLPGARERDEKDLFPMEILKELQDMGLMTASVPEEYGGMGISTSDLISIIRELSYGSSGLTCTLAGNMLMLVSVFRFGNQELRKKVAESVLNKLSLGSFCFVEPHSGSDIFNTKTKAVRVPGGYSISGQKCFITNACYSEHFVVMAMQSNPETGKDSLTAFYVSGGSKGLSTGAPLKKMGQRDSNQSEVFFDNVFVPSSHLLGKECEGMKVAVTSLERSRTLFAASAVGVCDRARDLAVEFLTEREHYGKPLLSQPAIRNHLSQLETEATASWYMACAAASYWDSGATELQYSSMAKMYSGQVVVKFVGAVLELFAGWGFTREFEIERLYRDAKLYEIAEGPTFVQQAIIARELFPEKREKAVLKKVA